MKSWEVALLALSIAVSAAVGYAAQAAYRRRARSVLVHSLASQGLAPAMIPAADVTASRFSFLAGVGGGKHSVRTAISGTIDGKPCVFLELRAGAAPGISLAVHGIHCEDAGERGTWTSAFADAAVLAAVGVAPHAAGNAGTALECELAAIGAAVAPLRGQSTRPLWIEVARPWCVIGTTGVLSRRKLPAIVRALRRLHGAAAVVSPEQRSHR
ncbi:MAG: hypothetical protein L0Z55_08865 [Planctomycetes bacterium]|nr:hypothetical protein [Planctomycetota bacterium]